MKSALEQSFALFWKACKGPALIAESRLIPGRKWRCDYVHPESRIVIELEGGVWSNGRHSRGAGFVADCEKYLALTLAGYRVIRLTKEQITVPIIERIVEFMRGKSI